MVHSDQMGVFIVLINDVYFSCEHMGIPDMSVSQASLLLLLAPHASSCCRNAPAEDHQGDGDA